MKKITLLICAGLVSAGLTAQVLEDFEAGIPAGWTTVANTGTCTWLLDADGATGYNGGTPFSATQLMVFDDDDACGDGSAAPASNSSLISDVYDLSSTDGAPTVGYDYHFIELGAGETLLVEWFDGTDWQVFASYDTSVASDTDLSNETLVGSGIVNPDFQMRWTYDDAGDWAWHAAVDNFQLDFNVLSTDDNQIAGFSMYPNPAKDMVTVRAQNEIQNVAFFNILGQKVLEVSPNALTQEINVATLKAGVYIVNVTSDEQIGSYRLIKQ